MNRVRKNFGKKKLSQAMKDGLAVGEANGIAPTTGRVFGWNVDGSIYCACAIGFALLGTVPLEELQENFGVKNLMISTETLLEEAYPEVKKESTFLNTETRRHYGSVKSSIIVMNDSCGTPVLEIAETLEKCNL